MRGIIMLNSGTNRSSVVMTKAEENGDEVSGEDVEEIRDFEQCGCQIGCCGCQSRRWAVKCLNCCNTAKGALFFLCLVGFFQGFVMNGLINIVISTLERRYNLRSSETGLIASTYDIGSCLSLLFVTYVGGRGHKPLWLGWGTMLMGLGSIVFSLPHFVAPAYSIAGAEGGCNATSLCAETSVRVYRGFFILSQLLHGIGATPLYTLALTYLDENVEQRYSSVYHGIFYGFSVFGPGAGFLFGGYFLSFYTNPGESINITNESTLWVGNWWAGFLIGGVCFFLLSIPMLMYPRQLPGTDHVRVGRGNEMHQSEDAIRVSEDENFGKSFRDAPRCLLILLKNPTIVFLSLAGAMDNGLIAAIATFGPKYVETMFSLSASTAAFHFGILAIVAAFFGQVIGGLIVWKFNFTVPKMIVLTIAQSFLALACFFIFLLHCENAKIAGATFPYTGEYAIQCASKCGGCSVELYDPVCGADNLTYLSFCDAGCDRTDASHYENCTRVLASDSISSPSEASASRGKCVTDACPNLMLFLIITAFGVFFVFLGAMPSLQASLRCVPFAQRSFAIGIQWLILRLVGSIPLPNILGSVLDLACVVWGEECGECGSCNLYDTRNMSLYKFSVIITTKAVSIVFYFVAWKTYKAPKAGEVDLVAKTTDDVGTNGDVNGAGAENRAQHDKQLPEAGSMAYDNPTFVQ